MGNKILILVGVVALLVAGYIGLMSTVNPEEGVNLGYRENTGETTILSGVTSTATGVTASVVYYRNIGATVATNIASGTLKFACSLQDASPTFSETATATNTWDYVDFTNFQNNTSVDGDTGITLANTTGVEQLYITGNNFRWCTAILSGTVSGTTTVKFKPSDNS